LGLPNKWPVVSGELEKFPIFWVSANLFFLGVAVYRQKIRLARSLQDEVEPHGGVHQKGDFKCSPPPILATLLSALPARS
jgi:hypothetical protein